MKHILFSLLLTMVLVANATNTSKLNTSTLNVKNGNTYITINIDCDNIKDECSEILTYDDITKIKTIAKLKSYKSWMRLMKSGRLELISVKYRYNRKVLTFIICHSYDGKLMSNRYGSEILRMSKE